MAEQSQETENAVRKLKEAAAKKQNETKGRGSRNKTATPYVWHVRSCVDYGDCSGFLDITMIGGLK